MKTYPKFSIKDIIFLATAGNSRNLIMIVFIFFFSHDCQIPFQYMYLFNDFGVEQGCKMCQNIYNCRNCHIVYISEMEFGWEGILQLSQTGESKAYNQDVDFILRVGQGVDSLAGKGFSQ